MSKKYDYLIVGAGLFGSTFAWRATQAGKRCIVIDKRDHIAGNCYTENQNGVNIHKYGPHIFHTSSESTWNHVNQFADFNNFSYRPKVDFNGEIYSFPINLMTLYQVYGVKTPEEARQMLASERVKIDNPQNLEEWCLSKVGVLLYETFIQGYTKKQWWRDPKDLPASIIKRIPIRLTYDDNYFNDRYQGIPISGYTPMFEKMLKKSDVHLNSEFFSYEWHGRANRILYTGMIDEYYDYQFGELEYRGLRFETEWKDTSDWQGNAAINYTAEDVPYTRIIEHAHFQQQLPISTAITREYPTEYKKGDIPYYPVGDKKNLEIYAKYKELADQEKNVIFGGRLANYIYADMHQIIPMAMKLADKEGL